MAVSDDWSKGAREARKMLADQHIRALGRGVAQRGRFRNVVAAQVIGSSFQETPVHIMIERVAPQHPGSGMRRRCEA